MFDAHNHFTNINSIYCTAELLPQYINDEYDINKIVTSEIGLDKRFENRIPLEKQIGTFKKLLNYAIDNNIPISLHCVQRTNVLLSILKEFKIKKNTIIWHGFNGSIETARILDKLGILISISPKFNKNIAELYNNVSVLLLESDYEGHSADEHSRIIMEMYNKVSKDTNIPISTIEENSINATKAFANRINFGN